MVNFEELFWGLTKFIDLHFNRFTFYGFLDGVEINGSLVCEMMEDVYSLNSCRTSLFISENEIDPIVEVLRDILTFKCLPVNFKELLS